MANYKLEKGQRGEEGYYRLALDLPLTIDEVRFIAALLTDEGWTIGEEIAEDLARLEQE